MTALLPAAVPAVAQDIATEVVVERTVQPEERAATRPQQLIPQLVLPAATPVTLSPVTYTALSPLQRSYTRLQPLPGAAVPEESPWRGYVSAAYGPAYNLGIAAGYRVLSTATHQLDIHLDFDGFSYKPGAAGYEKYSYNGGTVGGDYSLHLGQASTLRASLAYAFAADASMYHHSQSRNAARLDVGWESELQGLEYNAWLHTDLSAYGDVKFRTVPEETELRGLKSTRLALGGTAVLPLGEDFGFGAAIRGDFNHTSADAAAGGSRSPGILALRPFVRLVNTAVTATAGVNFDYFCGPGARLYVSPQVEVAWTPAETLSLRAAATGGTGFNTVDDMTALSPFIAGIRDYDRYRLPWDVSAAVTVGPYAGFTATIEAGFAKAEGLLAPGRPGDADPLMRRTFKGLHAGASLAYSHRLFGVHVSGEIAQNDPAAGKGYYIWRDNARLVVKAGGHVEPLTGLRIAVDYEFRDRRATPWQSLGCVSDLSARADYRITPTVGVFITGSNLLGRRYLTVPGIESQKTVALAGVSLRF